VKTEKLTTAASPCVQLFIESLFDAVSGLNAKDAPMFQSTQTLALTKQSLAESVKEESLSSC
jgi:hypothetical protein